MDRLQDCAKAFEHLLDTTYHIVIGRKGNTVTIDIAFKAEHFHHLLGLHKLRDIEALSHKREKVFDDILAGRISFSDIEKSCSFGEIKGRVDPLTNMENILDDNRLIFRYNNKANSFSLIHAEYLLSTDYNQDIVYIFLDKIGNGDQFFCRSFFPKTGKDYTEGQARYALLYKEKVRISTGERIVQLDKLSPKSENLTAQIIAEAKQEAADLLQSITQDPTEGRRR